MPKVYSYLRFSDPRQAAGSSADRQAQYAERWAAEHGLVLDAALSMADHGLSAYHQRHVKVGALGVFLRAVEAGLIDSGSVLIVEGLDRLSRAEPLKAQAQLTQIIHSGIRVVTAADGQEYSLESIKENPYRLIHSLVVMIRAHEESDTKSKRVRAAIRRQCEAWQSGTFRGIIRNGRDPLWVKWNGSTFEMDAARAEAMRHAIDLFLSGHGAVRAVRELTARGLPITSTASLYKTLKKRLLVGERELRVDGEPYRLAGYYPALLTDEQFDALQLAVDRRGGRRGTGEIPGLMTGMGIMTCGYCGGAIIHQASLSRRGADGTLATGHRRLICGNITNGRGCKVGGSIQAAPVETALVLYSANAMRMEDLAGGGDQGAGLRAELARSRAKLAETETRLDRLARALAEDNEAAPLSVLRQIRTMEAEAESLKKSISGLERELSPQAAPASADDAERWLDLMDGIERMDTDARLQARELVRVTFSRIVLWHNEDGGRAFDLELSLRGGGSRRMRFERKSGGLIG